MIATEAEEIMMTDEVVAIATDQDHNMTIGDEMVAVTVVAVEAAEVVVVIAVVDVAEEEVVVVDEVVLVANVTVLSLLIGIDWTVPDDVKLKRQKQ